jgi:hypothetical protein
LTKVKSTFGCDLRKYFGYGLKNDNGAVMAAGLNAMEMVIRSNTFETWLGVDFEASGTNT